MVPAEDATFVNELYLTLVGGAITLVAAGVGIFVGAKLALDSYFRQKEYELVKERYLEGAVDVVASEVEQSFEIFWHNWQRCLNVFKAFRDEKNAFDQKELSLGFLGYELSFQRLAHHRIGELVGSQSIWKVYQLAIAFANNANAKITKEMPEVIRLKMRGEPAMAPIEEIVEAIFGDLRRLDQDAHHFAELTRALNDLGRILERQRLTFKAVGKFRCRRDVKSILSRLEHAFKSDLADIDIADSSADALAAGR